MGFFSGRVTFVRYRVQGASPGTFRPEHLERLSANAAGKQRVAAGADGVEVCTARAYPVRHTPSDLAKNVVDDALHFALRVDSQKLPSDLLRAYYAQEVQAQAASNPSGLPSARQKKEARITARERLEEEAKD